MKLLISGSSGLIGAAARNHFQNQGHYVCALRRSAEDLLPGDLLWDPITGKIDANLLEGFDAIIHLAGENIATGRWSESKKNKIRDSRVRDTTLLSETISQLRKKPSVFICASATGFYGNRGEQTLDENSGPGDGFLPEVCSAWELATSAASKSGVRVVNLRIGIVLSPDAGALAKMLLPFRLGIGGRIGSGKQYMSWISLQDLIRIIDFALTEPQLLGPVNAVSPEPITNAHFAKQLAHTLHRPALAIFPAFAARLALGAIADDLLLASTRVVPQQLMEKGFTFHDPLLAPTLERLVAGNPSADSIYLTEAWLPSPRDQVFDFFCNPKNLEIITPPWLNFRIHSQSTPSIQEGTEFTYQLKIHGIPVHWKSRIEHWRPEREFADTQLSGPYSKWYHTHRFYDHAGGTLMKDEVRYVVPGGWAGRFIGKVFVKREVQEIFNYRRKVIAERFGDQHSPGLGNVYQLKRVTHKEHYI